MLSKNWVLSMGCYNLYKEIVIFNEWEVFASWWNSREYDLIIFLLCLCYILSNMKYSLYCKYNSLIITLLII